MSLILLAPIPWAGRVWALAILPALVPSEHACRGRGPSAQAVAQRRWPTRPPGPNPTFAEVVMWEDGRFRYAGRVDMTRSGLDGFARTLRGDDEVVIEATSNAMFVSHPLRPHVARVVIANPLQVKAIAYAYVKIDKTDAGVLANLYAAGFLSEVWTPDAATERLRRLAAQPGGRPSHGAQERDPRDPARPPRAAVPACRTVQPGRPGFSDGGACADLCGGAPPTNNWHGRIIAARIDISLNSVRWKRPAHLMRAPEPARSSACTIQISPSRRWEVSSVS